MKVEIVESWSSAKTIGLAVSYSIEDKEILIHFLFHGIFIKL
jgi:hypothetical protein